MPQTTAGQPATGWLDPAPFLRGVAWLDAGDGRCGRTRTM